MMIVLSLSSSCEASIEGIVPDAERGRAMSECWLCAGDGEGGRKERCLFTRLAPLSNPRACPGSAARIRHNIRRRVMPPPAHSPTFHAHRKH